MTDRNLMILGGMIGAVVGVGMGFVLFTKRGRQLRADLEPEIEGVLREAVKLSQIVDQFSNRAAAPPGAAAPRALADRIA